CVDMPRTFVHADCHEGNLRVRTEQAEAFILAFDWEAACLAVPAVDLALAGLDVHTYWSLVRKFWSGLEMRTLTRLARIGKIFQLLALVDWESKGLGSQWPSKTMKHMRYYRTEMSHALEVAEL